MIFDKKDVQKDLDKTIDALSYNLNSVRAGKLVPEFIANVVVNESGSKLKSVANISNIDNFSLKVSPWDSSLRSDIVSSLQNSGLGVGVNSIANDIIITASKLTNETRKELAKIVNVYGEEAKVSLRNKRRDSIDKVKSTEKKKEISEDQSRTYQKDIDKIVEQYVKEIDKIVSIKVQDILTV